MSRKKTFKSDTELQKLIIQARESGLSLSEIAEMYPQYASITYERFLKEIGCKSRFDRKSQLNKQKASDAAKHGWSNMPEEKKSKHINHLRSLAQSQKGKTMEHSDEWLAKIRAGSAKRFEKLKDVFQEKYGVDNPSYIPSVIEKRRQTCLRKYGCDSFFQTAEFAGLPTVKIKHSKDELEILSWVQSLGIECGSIRIEGKELDIFIPALNLGIEFNGNYWHSERYKRKTHLLEKKQFFADHGVDVIHVFEHEWKFRQSQVKSFLLSKLQANQCKIYARCCELRLVPKQIATDFVKEYHIQGAGKVHEAFGLYFQDELVCVATISRHHRNTTQFVLNRFAVKTNTSVVGGLSKISKHLKKMYPNLITWCDLRWSNGNGYLSSGWTHIATLQPDYFYMGRGVKNLHIPKQSRQKKKVGTPTGMTELEHAHADGLLRVWDCGKMTFLLK